MSRTSRALAALAALTLALTGCTAKNEPSSAAPSGDALAIVGEAAVTMAAVNTVHFTIDVNGKIADLTLHHAEGDLKKDGSAKGKATIEQFGATVEAEFVIVDKKLYVKGPTGGFQELPLAAAATVYDPSAILDPGRGVAKLLAAARDPKLLGTEQVNGSDAYKISLETDKAALASLIPGAVDGITSVLWVDIATKKLVKGEFTVPASGDSKGGVVTATFTNYDAPVTISAP
jgi:lipoprotein LprG